MSTASIAEGVPVRQAAVLLVVLLLVSLGYSIVVMQSFAIWVTAWGTVVSVGLGLFVVYLFYRLVLAVETIAYER